MPNSWDAYEGEAGTRIAAGYETVDAQDLHSWFADLLPDRDAAWLASKGHDMVAAEPSATMLAQARSRHPDPRIVWVRDGLPSLAAVHRLGKSFDLILLSAVWMHVRPSDRPRVFRKKANLLRRGGVLAITLRHGPRALTARCTRHRVGLGEPERPVWQATA